MIAGISSRLSRLRGNGISLNVLLLVACGVALGIGADVQLRDASQYGRPPQRMPVAEVLTRPDLENRYVTLVGTLAPDEALVHGSDRSFLNDRKIYAPLVERRLSQGVLIEQNGDRNRIPAAAGKEVAVTGMLRHPPSDLARHLRDQGGQLGEFGINLEYQLEAGAAPVNPIT